MYYGKIRENDIANGSGVRVSLFVSGCRNHCKNCFQPETWDFQYGQPYTEETEKHIIESLSHPYIQGLTLLGGEPLEPENQEVLIRLLRKVKSKCPEKDVWCYTGYTLEQTLQDGSPCRCAVTDELLSLIDTLVDGRYEDELRDISLKFRGSSNQRLIDMKKEREKDDWEKKGHAI
ncbi:MAG: anaerobic ribonucleoside-triphosphate reductase activating protein [Eubacteriales bacterium]|nr:anaerobic ribonucleoside-triphosphate reductase activating protein [Eubacteriales bacterium]